jgi:hypothetical protein
MRQIVVTLSDASGGAKTSQTLPLDIHGRPDISLQVAVTGTANWTVQQTVDNVFDLSITPTWFDHPDTNMVAQTVNRQGNYAYVPSATRIVLNSGTGSVRFTVLQSGDNRA